MLKTISQKLKTIPHYLYSNIIYPKLLNIKYRAVLNKNKSLKNSQRGKRCFILATGPSINDIDLSLFKNEQVLVVNDFIRHPKFKEFKPSYYLMSDTGFFDSEKETDFFGRNLKNKSDNINSDTKMFLNIVGKKLIEDRHLFNCNDIYYLSIHGIISENFNFNINLDKTISSPKNVIVAALMIAVYLGFEDIYLLGCEHDFLTQLIRQGKIWDVSHFYGVNHENPQETNLNDIQEQGLYRSTAVTYEAEIAHVKQLFKNYRLFYNKIKKTNPRVKIYNATPNSYLDIFPFVDFADIKLKK